MRPTSLSLATLLILASCGGNTPAGSAPPAPATVAPTAAPSRTPAAVLDVPVERSTLKVVMVPPAETDAAIPATAAPHLVAFDPAAARRGQLFVFMAGNAILPGDAALIVRQAAANGLHAIGLDYPRDVKVPTLCETAADQACYEKVRLETFDGEDRAAQIAVSRANSIANRLTKLIVHLATRSPDEGWSAYLADGAPKWSLIRLGGQSEGGTHAAMIAREREVARLCMLEAPVDLISLPGTERRLAPWLAAPRATPAERHFVFRHMRSSSALAPAFPLAVTAMAIDRFGMPTDADTTRAPYNGSHHLTTNADPVSDGQPNLTHRSVVQDRATPRSPGGQPLFAPVWQYACFS